MTQLDSLKKVINSRTMGICYHGRSIMTLEERIGALNGTDICWAGINDFWVMEKHILSPIGEQFDIVICSARENLVPHEKHLEFLNRQDVNMMVLDQDSIHPGQIEKNFIHPLKTLYAADFIAHYRDKLFFFTADRTQEALKHPDKGHLLHFFAQSSFSILILLGIIGGAKDIILFGTEGFVPGDTGELQYPKRNSEGHGQSNKQRLVNDTALFRYTFNDVLRNIYMAYNLSAISIIHCNEKSHYGVFPVRNYDECFNQILGN